MVRGKLSRFSAYLVITLVLFTTLVVACAQPAPTTPAPKPAPAPTTVTPVPTTATPAPTTAAPAPTTPKPTTAPTATPTPTQAPIVLKFAHQDPPTSTLVINCFEPTFKAMEERSGGRLKITRYYSGSLLSGRETYPGVLSGIADFTKSPVGYTPGLFQLTTLGMLPYAAVKDPNNGVMAMNQLIQKGYMDEDLKGVKFLSVMTSSLYSFLFKSKRPATFDELKGIKMRNPGAYFGSIVKATGMVPVSLVPAEVYDALAKGVVEGIYWTRSSIIDFKSHEIGKYFLINDAASFSASLGIMNEKTWNSLPKDLQGVVADLMGEKFADLHLKAFNITDEPAEKKMREVGIEFYSLPQAEVDKMKKALLPVWQEGVDDLNKKGLNGKQVMTEYVNILKSLGENPPWTP